MEGEKPKEGERARRRSCRREVYKEYQRGV
jgi:hypothetical protein